VRFCEWKGFLIHAWHIGDEHMHLFITIPPKYSVSYAVAIIKGKSLAWLKKQTKKFPKGTLWNRGYFIFTVGINQKFS
jgi:putative transposase